VDFLELFNEVVKVVKPAFAGQLTPITDADKPLKGTHVDSLDLLMVVIYMCELYGVSEEVGKEAKPTTVAELQAFLEQHKTKEPASVQEALEQIR
jgi:acyl carrier protein